MRTKHRAPALFKNNFRSNSTRAITEPLEARQLLSVGTLTSALTAQQITQLAQTHFAQSMVRVLGTPGGSISPLASVPVGLVPSQIRGAYGLGQVGSSTITFGAVQGDGTGQTIAIIDGFDDTNALSDLQHFDAQFGLNDPVFQKLNENGAASPLPSPAPLGDAALETSLDIEWSHVMAPQAHIDLIECNSMSFFDLLEEGAFNAARLPGVSVVSMSFGGSEFAGESALDSFMTSPTATSGVTFLASTGDTGSPGSYPAYAETTVAVGGTHLNVVGNAYSSETGWTGSGGGISQQEFQPSFQTPFFTSTQRTEPDVSMDADPNTGVAVYDSYDFPSSPWIQVGGTSLAAPLWAGVTAVVNQGRVFHSLAPLDGAGQTLPLLYSLPSTDFHDPLTGSNGAFTAGPGYDLVTGRGSPIGNLLIPDLATAAAPTRLSDLQPLQPFNWSAPIVLSTASGSQTDPTQIVPGNSIFLNGAWLNNGSVAEASSFLVDFHFAGTDLGAPSSPGISPGNGLEITNAAIGTFGNGISELSMFVDSGNAVTESTETNNIYTRTYTIDNVANNHYGLQLDASGTNVQITKNNVVAYSVAKSAVNGFLFYLSGSGDTLSVDASNGNPIPYGQVVDGGSSASNSLGVNGTPGNNTLTVNQSQLTLNGQIINYTGIGSIVITTGSGNDTLTQLAQPAAAIAFLPGFGTDTLNINAGAYTFQPSFTGIAQQIFAVLNIASGASVTLLFSSSTNRTVLTLGTLTNLGLLNLNNNAMILHSGSLTAIASQIKAGFNSPAGYWNGSTGITSTTAANDTTFLTALGNRAGGNPLDGVPTVPTDILVKYTYYGDATLDGLVNGSDYQQIDNGFGTGATDWSHGDFNYDSIVNGSDFALIDNTFNQLTARGLSATPLAQDAAPTITTTNTSAAVPSLANASTPFSPAPLIAAGASNGASDLLDESIRHRTTHGTLAPK